MLDNRNLQTAFTAFLFLLLVLFQYSSSKSFANSRNRRRYRFSLFFLSLLCVFAFYNDYWSLEESIPQLANNNEYFSGGLEKVYIWIANLCNYNYRLWRFVCWGIGVIGIAILLKHYKIDNIFSLFVICSCYFWIFGYARSSIAMVLFTAGYSFLSTSGRLSQLRYIVIGVLIMFASLFAHKSQAICLIAFPILFLKKDRTFFIISMCCLPFAVALLNYGLEHMDYLFSTQSSSYYDLDLLQSKAERYLSYNKEEGYGATRLLLGFVNQVVEYILVCYVVLVLSIKNRIKEANVDIKVIYSLMYALAYFSLAAAFGGLEQSVFSYRIFNMSFYAAIICLLLMQKGKIVTTKSVLFLSLLCFGARILESLIYELYVVYA